MRTTSKINIFLLSALCAQIIFWLGSNSTFARWGGVPPTPSFLGASVMSLSDTQFFFRFGALNLQTLGDTGAETTSLRDYNYQDLSKWFWLLHKLDPASNDVPMIAAFYFGGTYVPDDAKVVVDYLSYVGQNPYGNKWRWLAHAVYLARHRMKDLNRALDLAYILSRMELVDDTLPPWARRMPAMILEEKGDAEAARELLTGILTTQSYVDPNEVKFIKNYLTKELGMDRSSVEKIIETREKMSIDPEPIKKQPIPMP